jgi:hypothetical protein
MSMPVSVLPSGVVNAAAPATVKVPGTARAQAATGPLTVQSDVMQFPGPQVTGNWMVAATRVKAGGVFVVNQASTGTSVGPAPVTPGPMTVVMGDLRIKAM